ncbi:MAG: nucleotide pyrophosphohydrolase [Candidatus Muiribacteriota bacterium]|jgi:NTP pyrophosphatase (non-canonical NTP hydrolase)
MTDNKTTIEDLKKFIDVFVEERNWKQFHTPKNLSMSISIEAAELMENFQWLESAKSHDIVNDKANFENVKDEISDIVVYCINLANVLNIDLAESIEHKMKKNRKKYPVEKAKGSSRKYNQL